MARVAASAARSAGVSPFRSRSADPAGHAASSTAAVPAIPRLAAPWQGPPSRVKDHIASVQGV